MICCSYQKVFLTSERVLKRIDILTYYRLPVVAKNEKTQLLDKTDTITDKTKD